MFEALPLLDDNKSIGSEFGAGAALGVDHRAVFDAPGFRVNRWHVGAESGQHLVALAGLGGDDGENVDHRFLRIWPGTIGGGQAPSQAIARGKKFFTGGREDRSLPPSEVLSGLDFRPPSTGGLDAP